MDKAKNTQFINKLLQVGVWLGSLAVLTVCSAVLVAWYAKVPSVIQISPHFAPMQFNTALCFVLASSSLVFVQKRYFSVAYCTAILLVLLSGLSGLQYLLNLNFGIDQLFMDAFLTVKTSHPGRMAPNTALAFVCTGICVFVVAEYVRKNRFETLLCVLGSGVFLFGAIPFIGYVMEIEAAIGWGFLTRMALHTSICFITLSFVLMAFLLRQNQPDYFIERRWIPIFSGSIILFLGMFIFSILHQYQLEAVNDLVHYKDVLTGREITRLTELNASLIPLFCLIVFVVIAMITSVLVRYIQKSFIYNKALSKMHHDAYIRVENITEVLSNIAQLNFSKQATITHDNAEFDILASQVNQVSDQLSAAITDMYEKQCLLESLNQKLESHSKEVSDQRLAALNIAADVREMLEKTEIAEHVASQHAARLEESNKSLEEFARIVSHDLQEPLRKVLMYSDKIKRGFERTETDVDVSYIHKMQNATQRMQQLISDILHYSRVTSVQVDVEPVDVHELTQELLEDLEVLITEKKGVINYQVSGTVVSSRVLLKQVLLNLIGNALKFSKENVPPVVAIRGEQREDDYWITVEDNGIGFEQEQAERIFEVFQRLHQRGVYKGTGIGLSICKKIVERLDGQINVVSELGKGTLFSVSLPLESSLNSEYKREHVGVI